MVIEAKLSKKISLAVFTATIIVVFRHSINIHVYFPNIYAEGPKDFNTYIQLFTNGFTNIAVPLFFIVSGFLFFYKFEIKETKKYFKKRFKTLLLPYLVWNILLLCFFIFIQKFEFTSQYSEYNIIELNPKSIMSNIFIKPILGQFWYIRDLMLFVLISPLILLFLKKKIVFYVYLILLVVFWEPIDTSFFSSEGLLFYSIGSFLGHYKSKLIFKFKKNVLVYLLITWVSIRLILINIDFIFQVKMAIEKISIILGLIVFWDILDYIKPTKKILYFGSFSFFIYAFQSPLIKMVYKLLLTALPESQISGLLVYGTLPILIIIFGIAIGFLIRSKSNYFYRILTGNR